MLNVLSAEWRWATAYSFWVDTDKHIAQTYTVGSREM